MQKHPDPTVDRLLHQLCDALCSWERSTNRQSILILREQGGFAFRAASGKPNVPDDIPDEHVIKNILGPDEALPSFE